MYNEIKAIIIATTGFIFIYSCNTTGHNSSDSVKPASTINYDNFFIANKYAILEDADNEGSIIGIYLADLGCSSCSNKELAILIHYQKKLKKRLLFGVNSTQIGNIKFLQIKQMLKYID